MTDVQEAITEPSGDMINSTAIPESLPVAQVLQSSNQVETEESQIMESDGGVKIVNSAGSQSTQVPTDLPLGNYTTTSPNTQAEKTLPESDSSASQTTADNLSIMGIEMQSKNDQHESGLDLDSSNRAAVTVVAVADKATVDITTTAMPASATHTGASDHDPANEGPSLERDPEGEWEMDSSPLSSDSSETSDSDTSSDNSDDEYEMLDPATAAKMMMAGGDEDETDDIAPGSISKVQVRTQNEQAPVPIPRPDVVITPGTKLLPLGAVASIVDNMVLIKGDTTGEYQVLEQGSVLCLENRTVLGAVAETFGRVQEPMYSVAFTTKSEIDELNASAGTKIMYVDDHSTFVFTQPLRAQKFTDASNLHDEELGEDEMEFSDDEAEAAYKKAKKEAKKANGRARFGANANDQAPNKVIATTSRTGPISYDDEEDGDDSYTPLTRPGAFAGTSTNTANYQGGRGQGRGGFARGAGRSRGGRGARGGTAGQWNGYRAQTHQTNGGPSQQPQASAQWPMQQHYGQGSNMPAYSPQPAYNAYTNQAQSTHDSFQSAMYQQAGAIPQGGQFNAAALYAAQQQYVQQQAQYQQQQQLFQQQATLRQILQQQSQAQQASAPANTQDSVANPHWAGQAMQEHLARLRQQANNQQG